MTTEQPAFPSVMPGRQADHYHPGMDLRDFFASQMMPAFFPSTGQFRSPANIEVAAADCYRAADAMMEARKL